MGYADIENLYKDQKVLLFKEAWALEKVDGCSAWLDYRENNLFYHTGCGNKAGFPKLFDHEKLLAYMREHFGSKDVTLYGEHYGGSIQNNHQFMYGKEQDFIMFDIKVGDVWLSFDKVKKLGKAMGIPVVNGVLVKATKDMLDKVRTAPSDLSIKKGCGKRMREGIVIRPLEEFTSNNGDRVIAKYKNEEFEKEMKSPRNIDDPARLKVLTEAREIAEEWVLPARLNHLLSNPTKYGIPENPDKKDTGAVIKAMVADVEKESKGETVITDAVKKAIGEKARAIFFDYLNEKIK